MKTASEYHNHWKIILYFIPETILKPLVPSTLQETEQSQ